MALNDLIPFYLQSIGKTAQPGDWSINQPDGQPEQIAIWNATDLGPQPTVAQVETAAGVPQAIAAKLAALEAYATAYEHGGTTVSGRYYDTDDTTQAKLAAAYNLAQTALSPATFNRYTSKGFAQYTQAQITSDVPVVGAWVEAVFTNMQAHLTNIEALTSVVAVQAYNFTTGWPQGT